MRPGASTGDWIGLASLALMWGTAFVFIRRAVDSIAPVSVAAGRIVAAAVVLLLLVRLAGLRLPRGARRWAWFALLAVIGNALPFYLISWGQQGVPSALTGVLMAVNPLATLMLAHVFVDGERLHARRAAGFALGFGGVVLLIGPSALLELGGTPSDLVHQAAILGGALCYAANSILVRLMPETPPLVSSTAVLAVAAVLILPIALGVDGFDVAGDDPVAFGAVLWLGVVPTALATIVYFRLIGSAGPTFLSLVNFPVPVVAVATGAAVYAERLDPSDFAALALILAGLALGRPGDAPSRL